MPSEKHDNEEFTMEIKEKKNFDNNVKKDDATMTVECESRCYKCNYSSDGKVYNPKPNFWKLINFNKKIQRVVNVPSSLYTSELSSLNTYVNSRCNNANPPICGVNGLPSFPAGTWNQSSDRIFPSRSLLFNSFNNVPSRGNSTKSSLTRNRPGSSAPGGKGVDVKHNSYARYLARLKGKNIKSKFNLTRNTFKNTIKNLNIENKSNNNKPLPLMIVTQSSRNNNTVNGNSCSCN